jgi:hypothetical protein
MPSMISRVRIRLPVWVVSIRSLLRFNCGDSYLLIDVAYAC